MPLVMQEKTEDAAFSYSGGWLVLNGHYEPRAYPERGQVGLAAADALRLKRFIDSLHPLIDADEEAARHVKQAARQARIDELRRKLRELEATPV